MHDAELVRWWVTHVNDDATIPAAGAWVPSFATPGRNDFRVQAAEPLRLADAVATHNDAVTFGCD